MKKGEVIAKIKLDKWAKIVACSYVGCYENCKGLNMMNINIHVL